MTASAVTASAATASPPVEAFLSHLQVERRMSAHTLDAYRRDLEQAAEWVKGPLGEADAPALRKLMADYQSLAASSAARTSTACWYCCATRTTRSR